MSRDLGRDVPDLDKHYARKLWADFSFPRLGSSSRKCQLDWFLFKAQSTPKTIMELCKGS